MDSEKHKDVPSKSVLCDLPDDLTALPGSRVWARRLLGRSRHCPPDGSRLVARPKIRVAADGLFIRICGSDSGRQADGMFTGMDDLRFRGGAGCLGSRLA